MDHRDRIRAKAEARLARLKPNTGHARILRARLGLDVQSASIKEEVVIPEVETTEKSKKRKRNVRPTSER